MGDTRIKFYPGCSRSGQRGGGAFVPLFATALSPQVGDFFFALRGKQRLSSHRERGRDTVGSGDSGGPGDDTGSIRSCRAALLRTFPSLSGLGAL